MYIYVYKYTLCFGNEYRSEKNILGNSYKFGKETFRKYSFLFFRASGYQRSNLSAPTNIMLAWDYAQQMRLYVRNDLNVGTLIL